MQILALVLYNHTGQQRILPLRPGQVNIITGRSATGKSALISIVEYVLGGKCEIAGQVIRDHVAWYGLHLQYPGSQLFLARRDPGAAKESADYFVLEGETVDIPQAIDTANTSTTAITDLLTSKLGIAPNYHEPSEGQTRHAVSATIRHALILNFQEQDEIATRRKLFHRQEDYFRMQHFRDTLPVFLGVVEDNAVQLEQKLRDLRRELRIRRQKLEDEQSIRGQGISKAIRLIAEARSVGLLPKDFNESLTDLDGSVAALKRAADWEAQEIPELDTGSNILALQQERDSLTEQEMRLKEEDAALEVHMGKASDFTETVEEHTLRLESIGLYPDDFDHAHCPICHSQLETPIPSAQQLRNKLSELQGSLEYMQSSRPQLLSYINDISNRRREVQDRRKILEQEIEGIYQAHEAVRKLRNEQNARIHVAGRISLWLESANLTNDLEGLQREINAAFN